MLKQCINNSMCPQGWILSWKEVNSAAYDYEYLGNYMYTALPVISFYDWNAIRHRVNLKMGLIITQQTILGLWQGNIRPLVEIQHCGLSMDCQLSTGYQIFVLKYSTDSLNGLFLDVSISKNCNIYAKIGIEGNTEQMSLPSGDKVHIFSY